MNGPRRHAIGLSMVLISVAVAVGFAPPEVVRVKVPAAKVRQWFPKGSELVSLRVEELDRLIAKVEAVAREARQNGPLILRAAHRARWIDGVLIGESTFTVRRDSKPAAIALAPFNLNLEASEGKDFQVRTSDTGEVSLWLPPKGADEVTLRWRRPARSISTGRSFSVELPRTLLSQFDLDLPDDLVPDLFTSVEGAPSKPMPGRRLWRSFGLSGSREIVLRRSTEAIDLSKSLRRVGGPTFVDVGTSSANWRCEWSVESNATGAPLRVRFSEGLEPVDVTGPSVESFQVERTGRNAIATVRFRGGDRATSTIVIQGVVPLTTDAPWPVPAAEPIDGAWTGGLTTVRLDRSHAIQDCRVLTGRRIVPKTIGPIDKNVLAFEPDHAGPPAELTFVDPRYLRSADVRGEVRFATDRTSLAADLRWRFPVGNMPDLCFEIGEEWSIETITYEDDPLSWHRDPLDGSSGRIRILPATLDDEGPTFTIRVNAVRKSSARDRPFAMPRIRPIGVLIEDEVWLAHADGDRVVIPREVEGLAWLDPSVLKSTGLLPGGDPTALEHASAWRWTRKDGRFLATIEPAPRETRSTIEGRGVIAAGRFRTDWRLTIQPGTVTPPAIPVLWSVAPSTSIEWTTRDPDGQTHPVAVRPLSPAERSSTGFTETQGPAYAILVGRLGATSIDLRVSIDQPWSGSEAIPLPVLPESFNPSARIGIEVEKGLAFRAETKGLVSAMEPDPPSVGFLGVRDDSERGLRAASTFAYRDLVPQLRIETTTPLKRSPPSLIRSARLETDLTGAGSALHRLILVVDCVDTKSLDLKMPPQAKLIRALADGRIVTLATSLTGLSLPLNDSGTLRRRTLVVTYETPAPAFADTEHLRPEIPVLDVPCLDFTWRLTLPKRWGVKDHGRGFDVVGDLNHLDVKSFLMQGSLNVLRGLGATEKPSLDTLVESLEHVPAEASVTFLDAFVSLDANAIPVLVDAVGVEAIDLRSSSTQGGWQRKLAPNRLESGDVCLIPIDGAVVVTDRRGTLLRQLRRGSATATTRGAVASASINGVDPSGRFVSLDLWRGVDGSLVGSNTSVTSTSETFTFRSPGWPGPDARVEIEQPPRTIALGLMIAVFLVSAAFLLGRRSMRQRNRFLAIVILATLATLGYGAPIPAWLRAALALGAGGIVLTGIVPHRRGHSIDRDGRHGRSASRRAAISGLIVFLATLAGATASLPAKEDEAESNTVFALLPYEGEPGLDRSPDRVVMLLRDLDRLRAAAEPIVGPEFGRLTSVGASHTLTLDREGIALLSSAFILVLDESKPGEWKVPTDGAWDIRASVDGNPSPVRMIDEGRFAVVSLSGQGRRRLVIDRKLRPNVAGKVDSITVPINMVPMSRIEVVSKSDRSQIRAEGIIPVATPGSGVLSGEIGSSRSLDVEFRSPDPLRGGENKAGFTAMALWDVRTAGDFVRMRVHPVHDDPVSSLTLSLEPGTQIRLADLGRIATERWAGSTAKPEWSATFDPPFRAGDTISLELWRPLRPPDPVSPGASVRHFPMVGLTDNVPFSGVLAFRRPSDWSGRLSAQSGFDAIDEESFVKAWGALPDEPFTLSGVRGFQNVATAEVATAPLVLKRSVHPAITVELGEGRLDFIADAELKDPREQTTDLDMTVPPELIVDEFSAEGLIQMTRPERGRLHVELGMVEKPTRKIALRGHLLADVSADPSPVRRYESKVPWLTWRGISEEPVLLTIVSATKPQLAIGPGVIPVPLVGPVAALVPSALVRTTFQVETSADVGSLSWNVAPPSVSVHLVSRLTVEESNASLDTKIRYASSRGPIEELFLRVPSSWMKNARIELVGQTFQRTSETRGSSMFVTLRPKTPIWGVGCLVLRSNRECTSGEVISYPDVMPLGQGSAEKVIAVERRTVAPIEIEGSSGLQSIDPSRLAYGNPTDSSSSTVEAYRVKGDTWSLNLRLAGDPNASDTEDMSQVRSGEIACSLARDGSARGHARLFIDGRRGSPMRLRLGTTSEVVMCRSNDRPVIALSDDPGSWIVPVESNGQGIVEFDWTSPVATTGPSRGWLDLPRFVGLQDGLLIRVDTDPDLTLLTAPTAIEDLMAPIWLLDRAERTARRLVSLIGRYDRTSTSQERMIRSSLIGYEQEIAQARRSAETFQLSDASATGAFREQIRSRLSKMQALVTETQLANGLDEIVDRPGAAGSRADSMMGGGSSGLITYPGAARYFRLNPGLAPVGLSFERKSGARTDEFRFDVGLFFVVASIGLFATPRLARWQLPRSRFTSTTMLAVLILLAVVSPPSGFVMLWAVALGSFESRNGTGPITTSA